LPTKLVTLVASGIARKPGLLTVLGLSESMLSGDEVAHCVMPHGAMPEMNGGTA
jgi:hypothetical protein